jgi:uncharacterized protein (DUF983 family)
MVSDTKPESKKCSRCYETKEFDKFIKKRNICKVCANTSKKAKYAEAAAKADVNQTCNNCDQTKPMTDFMRNRPICKICHNEKRRKRYEDDEELRQRAVEQATLFKQKKAEERRKSKLEEIGLGNKKCSKCSTIKPEERFRHNRLMCKDCERDEPMIKFKRTVRSRIYAALANKSKHTIEYLGCNSIEYAEWLFTYDERYTIDNRGKEWHIDHVIPLSKFNLEDENEQLIAFNWRNTMPLSATENLSKNCKVIPEQIEEHLKILSDYHEKNKIQLPQNFIDLFAKHLVDGKPLKQSLPLASGNLCEDLG